MVWTIVPRLLDPGGFLHHMWGSPGEQGKSAFNWNCYHLACLSHRCTLHCSRGRVSSSLCYGWGLWRLSWAPDFPGVEGRKAGLSFWSYWWFRLSGFSARAWGCICWVWPLPGLVKMVLFLGWVSGCWHCHRLLAWPLARRLSALRWLTPLLSPAWLVLLAAL